MVLYGGEVGKMPPVKLHQSGYIMIYPAANAKNEDSSKRKRNTVPGACHEWVLINS
jgi:hypothetical protein